MVRSRYIIYVRAELELEGKMSILLQCYSSATPHPTLHVVSARPPVTGLLVLIIDFLLSIFRFIVPHFLTLGDSTEYLVKKMWQVVKKIAEKFPLY